MSFKIKNQRSKWVETNRTKGTKNKCKNALTTSGKNKISATLRFQRKRKKFKVRFKLNRIWGLEEEHGSKICEVLLTVSEMYKRSPSSKYSSSGWKIKARDCYSRPFSHSGSGSFKFQVSFFCVTTPRLFTFYPPIFHFFLHSSSAADTIMTAKVWFNCFDCWWRTYSKRGISD